MRFVSTRGGVPSVSFEDVVLHGLADDEGLFVPETIPQIDKETLNKWQDLSFTELTFQIMSLYISEEEIPRHTLRDLISRSMSQFSHPEITPVVPVNDIYLLELFHGPTFSFKDVALQFLGNLFEYILEKRKSHITVVGATSGDTGSAAIHGLKGKSNVDIFILYPKDRVSRLQELQMTTVPDGNVHTLRLVGGTFDDCQSIVKSLFGDLQFKKKYHLGAINSINWSRIMSQTVYYFYAYFQVKKRTQKEDLKIVFSVPTGNFGDIVAGYYAKRMGLPVQRLIVATNDNDILHRFFSRGDYHRADKVVATCTPSMDIQVASNFERYLYYLADEDSSVLRKWMDMFKTTGKLTITGTPHESSRSDFVSCSVPQTEVEATIASYHQDHRYIMDPHTAVGVCAVHKLMDASGKGSDARAARTAAFGEGPIELVCLSTAHPAKFNETVGRLVKGEDVVQGFAPARELMATGGEQARWTEIPATECDVRDTIEKTVAVVT